MEAMLFVKKAHEERSYDSGVFTARDKPAPTNGSRQKLRPSSILPCSLKSVFTAPGVARQLPQSKFQSISVNRDDS
jgi:hypothetical protein